MTKPGPSVTSGADTQPGSDSLFPSGFGGGSLVRTGGVGTGEIADGSIALADLSTAVTNTIPLATPATSTATTGTLTAGATHRLDATSAALARTLPSAAAAGAGGIVVVKKLDATSNAITVSAGGSDTVNVSGSTRTLTLPREAAHFRSDGVSDWTVVASDTPVAQLDSRYVQMVKAPTGVAATDTANIQAAHDALPSTGGNLQLQAGIYALSSTSPLTLSKPCTLAGFGGRIPGDGGATLQAVTTLNYADGASNAITVSAAGCTLRDFALICTAGSTPTSGTGLKITAASQCALNRVTVVGFWNNIETSGMYFTIDSCHIYDPVNYGIFLNNSLVNYSDHGDLGIHNCVISNLYKTWNGAAGIRWESGGGLRIIGNKFNGSILPVGVTAGKFAVCIDLLAADGAATGDCTISGNSIAAFTTAGIRVGMKGTVSGQFIDTNITGNQINVGTGSAVGITVAAASSSVQNQVRNVVITGNVFANIAGSSIQADNMKSLHIGSNVHDAVGSPVIRLGSGSITGGLICASVDTQNVRQDSIDLIQDWRGLAAATTMAMDGVVQHRYRRHSHLSATNTWQTVYTVRPYTTNSLGSAGRLKFTVTGANAALPFSAVYERLWSATTALVSPTLVTVGTDTTAGTGEMAVQFVLSTNLITVQVQILSGAANSAADMLCDLELQGPVITVHKGA